MFRIVGYTGDVDVPDLPDMDIDNDIADLTYEEHFQCDDWFTPDADVSRAARPVAFIR